MVQHHRLTDEEEHILRASSEELIADRFEEYGIGYTKSDIEAFADFVISYAEDVLENPDLDRNHVVELVDEMAEGGQAAEMNVSILIGMAHKQREAFFELANTGVEQDRRVVNDDE